VVVKTKITRTEFKVTVKKLEKKMKEGKITVAQFKKEKYKCKCKVPITKKSFKK